MAKRKKSVEDPNQMKLNLESKPKYTRAEDIPTEGYAPGLGCPHCNWAGYTLQDRTTHIRHDHPGEYAGPDAEMMLMMGRAGVQSDEFTNRRLRKMSEEDWGE